MTELKRQIGLINKLEQYDNSPVLITVDNREVCTEEATYTYCKLNDSDKQLLLALSTAEQIIAVIYSNYFDYGFTSDIKLTTPVGAL